MGYTLRMIEKVVYSFCTVLTSVWSIPKCQCSFTVLTTVCIVGFATSCALSRKYFWIFNNKTRLRLCKMNPQSFKSAVTPRNSKPGYYIHSASEGWRHQSTVKPVCNGPVYSGHPVYYVTENFPKIIPYIYC